MKILLLISNPKPDIHNIIPHTNFAENALIFTQVIQTQKYGRRDGRLTNRGMDEWTYDRRTDTWTTKMKP